MNPQELRCFRHRSDAGASAVHFARFYAALAEAAEHLVQRARAMASRIPGEVVCVRSAATGSSTRL
jgi:hypothetical protein